MSGAPTRRLRAAARALDTVYRHSGFAGTLRLADGSVLPKRLVIMRVHDREEGVDGSKIEVDMKGYAAQLRAEDLPATEALRHAQLTLDHAFDGHTLFTIDAEPRMLGREGLQVLAQLSALQSPPGGFA